MTDNKKFKNELIAKALKLAKLLISFSGKVSQKKSRLDN